MTRTVEPKIEAECRTLALIGTTDHRRDRRGIVTDATVMILRSSVSAASTEMGTVDRGPDGVPCDRRSFHHLRSEIVPCAKRKPQLR